MKKKTKSFGEMKPETNNNTYNIMKSTNFPHDSFYYDIANYRVFRNFSLDLLFSIFGERSANTKQIRETNLYEESKKVA